MNIKATCVGVALSIAAASVSAEPFVYQGELKVNSQPANGIFDLSFQLLDAPTGGTIIGSQFAAEDVLVEDGLFSVEVDFLTEMNGEDRWVEVLVREGDSEDRFTRLSPLQPLLATPKAQHANTADTVLNPAWYELGTTLRHGEGTDRVIINRTDVITGSEYFGVHADIAGYVGMYTSGLKGALPFYGYAADGDVLAYTYYQSSANAWRLWSNNAERLRVNEIGELEVFNSIIAEGEVQGDEFVYTAPKTRRIAVSGDVFVPTRDVPYASGIGLPGAFIAESSPGGSMVAPINLPDGATLVSMTAHCTDVVAGELSVQLVARNHNTTTHQTVFEVDTIGLSGFTLRPSDLTPNSLYDQVDYERYHYSLIVHGQDWPGDTSMCIRSVVVEYTMDGPG
tara:strand:+ start:172217 stop:173404 length:1188 start_codon:yes stop_codon:yes gene_type:complete